MDNNIVRNVYIIITDNNDENLILEHVDHALTTWCVQNNMIRYEIDPSIDNEVNKQIKKSGYQGHTPSRSSSN